MNCVRDGRRLDDGGGLGDKPANDDDVVFTYCGDNDVLLPIDAVLRCFKLGETLVSGDDNLDVDELR